MDKTPHLYLNFKVKQSREKKFKASEKARFFFVKLELNAIEYNMLVI